ncbi:hypothetical protein CMO90_04175 [Candidatus Woesearchaeota archaeon]|mgnify:CR=1 FL=1|jgi:hypothetical protein|nr:hypothetical protein [Candidatus Woesearchaeota archaeon]
MNDLDEFKDKYKARIRSGLRDDNLNPINTRDYETFKKEYIPKHLSFYEKACNFSEKIFKIKPDKKKIPEYQESIDICHLNITPTGAASFPITVFMFFLLTGLIIGFLIPFLFASEPSFFLIIILILVGIGLMIPLGNLPFFLANNWRMKSSNQMVLCIFYIVTYMRHTSNLELGIDFAAEHLSPPLSIDLKKIIWNIETEKFHSIKESLDNYLQTWRKWNMEFIESIHLIESSLYEPSESRRIDALDKSLKLMLEETYEKMLHYAQNLKSPITTLHMMGIILPILGLVILPLVVSFMPEVKWFHLFTFYNVILPIGVFYLGKRILSSRPTGYGESDISENSKELKKYKNILINLGGFEIKIHPIFVSIIILVVFLLIGFSPLLIHIVMPEFDCSIGEKTLCMNSLTHSNAKFYLLGYRPEIIEGSPTGKIMGPYGLGATLLSLAIPLGIGFSIGMYFKLRSKNVIKIREKAHKLEQEFSSAMFQLGNRLGDGLPAELAFSKVSDVMEGTISGKFFDAVSNNITKLGFSVEQAIFDSEKGVINYFPSPIIESSMKVLVESSKKGPIVASNALINVSNYIKEMHRVDERLKDLMADVISSMKSQISFLTPAISGIVIGITSMITAILGSLGERLGDLASQTEGVGGAGIMSMFGTGVPTFFFQAIVGLYVVQIVFILTILINGIQNGVDKLNERFLIGRNLIRASITYSIISFVVIMLFNIIAGSILGSVTQSLV